jgi:protocatechuate 3,4-dioxygenase beta subunit
MSCAIRSCLLFALLLAFPTPASAQRQAVWGVVTDSSGKPVIGAAVKLSNRVTLKIRSFITQADGKYRFRRLHPDMDYTVRAQKDGYRTKTRRLSHFKTSTVARADLRLDLGK